MHHTATHKNSRENSYDQKSENNNVDDFSV